MTSIPKLTKMKDLSIAEVAYQPNNPDYQELIQEKLKGQAFMKHLGMELTKVQPGYVEAELPASDFILQQDGFLHGGVTATLADIACGFAAFSLAFPGQRVVTADLNIQYFTIGNGVKYKAVGKVNKPGKRMHFCDAFIYAVDASGTEKLIAQARSIMAAFYPSKTS